jgi:hypothetical protein
LVWRLQAYKTQNLINLKKKKKKKKKKKLYFYMVLLGLYTKNKKCQSGIKKNIQLTYGKPNPKKMGVHQQVSWTKVQ